MNSNSSSRVSASFVNTTNVISPKVVIKHGANKHDVEVDPSSTGAEFKEIVYSLTGVEPERQKIFVKGGQLKDDADMGKLSLKPGQQIMMMGTPSAGGGDISRPKEKVKFVEDMTEAERAQQDGAIPSGLTNLGNTCYLNSTLQVLRAIPELQDSLAKYEYNSQSGSSAFGGLPLHDLTTQLKALFTSMGKTTDDFAPYIFLEALRQTYPQFAERSRTGHGYAQQDAEEAWSNILAQIRSNLKTQGGPSSEASVSWVDKHLALQMVESLECDDSEARERGEQPIVNTETYLKLDCHINAETNHLRDGILAGLKEGSIEKHSAVLDKNATYTKTAKISRLPQYLTVHFVRFFWKRDTQKKAKILRKVTFPKELDILEFCTEDLRAKLVPVRDRLREVIKDEEDIERARKRRKTNPVKEGEGSQPAQEEKKNKKDEKKPATDADGDTAMETYKTDAEWEEEKTKALESAKAELLGLVDQDLAKDEGANQTGIYELRGVITHQGSSADSGHYTAYVKKPGRKDPVTGKLGEEDGTWWWFNDDKVSEVPGEKIETLAGGGETHSALILLYKAVPLPSLADTK